MNDIVQKQNIEGWGADADKSKRPAYPMWKLAPTGAHWERPEQQEVKIEVFHSIERPEGITPVFGTSVPPSGLSGMIRRKAYQYSESSFGRWVPLLLADRINVVEGIIDDLAHGHVPNILKEMGFKAELRHNPKGAIRKLMIGSMILIGVPTFLYKFYNRERR